jgi:hypothetical protein
MNFKKRIKYYWIKLIKEIKNPFILLNLKIIIVSMTLGIINNLFLKRINLLILTNLFNCYFNDLLGAILILAYINLILFFFSYKKIKSLKIFIGLIFLIGFVWEYLAIFFKPYSVFDYVDFIAYFIGSLVYWRIIK